MTRERTNRKLLWAALGSLAIGVGPIGLNLLAEMAAAALDCYIAEFSIYSRSGTANDFGDDVPGCNWGSSDVGSLLVHLHNAGFAAIFTWPFVILSIVLWIWLCFRWLRAARSQKQS